MSDATLGLQLDDFLGSGDGSDAAALAAATAAIAAMGGGTIWVDPARTYQFAGAPLRLPDGVSLECQTPPGVSLTTGALIVDAGAATGAGFFANAMTLGRACSLRNLRLLSAAYVKAPPQTLIDMDAFVNGPLAAAGNGVQLGENADDCAIRGCVIAGFPVAIANLSPAAASGSCGARLIVEDLVCDGGTAIAARNVSDSGRVTGIKAHPFLNPDGIGTEPNFAFGPLQDDGAGGTLLPIATYKGQPQPLPAEVGTPADGAPFRILLADWRGKPVGSSAPAAPQQDWGPYPTNLFIALWHRAADGTWAFRLPGIPPASFGNIAGTAAGTLGIAAQKSAAGRTNGLPTQAGAAAMGQRPGAALDLVNAGEFPARDIDLQGPTIGVASTGNTRAEIDGLFMDTSPAVNAGTRCIQCNPGSLAIAVRGAHFSQYAIGVLNLAGSGSPTLPQPHRFSGVRSSAQLAHVIQAGAAIQLTDWNLGSGADMVFASGHGGAWLTAVAHPLVPEPVTYWMGPGAAAPAFFGCANAPTS